MTPTNSTIQTALNDILIAASLGYPIAWPGIDFTRPDSGEWLEVTFLPNRGVDDRLANDSEVSPQGIYQVVVASRPQSEIRLRVVAQTVQAVFTKGTRIADNVRVTRHPYTGTLQAESSRMSIAVTVEYGE